MEVPDKRFGEVPAKWIVEKAKKCQELEVEFIDLRTIDLPFFDEPVSPASNKGNYVNPKAKEWANKIAQGDGYIWITPEYNHSFSAVLKNAIDYVYPEWNKKVVAFVSYGAVGGARAVEHLRGVAAEVQMATIRRAVHIIAPWNLKDETGAIKTESFDSDGEEMLDHLTWWARALKEARNN